MREDQETRDDLITEIGDAAVLTKGDRLQLATEALGAVDKYDRIP